MARAPAVQEIEELPEADRLDGFPHPRATRRLFGHEAAEELLARAFTEGRMHHAWLVTGREGIGKATLAYRFATFALARTAEREASGASLAVAEDTSAARQVRALSHPGLFVLRRIFKEKRFTVSIPIEEVRRLKAFLALTADDAAWRVVIVDRADELNANAANALLKSLEEPPPRTVFLLLSSAPGSLLPTIRSRCRLLGLEPLRSEPLRRAMTQAITASGEEVGSGAPSPAEWERLEPLAGGSVRRLLALHAARGLDLDAKLASLFDALPKVDWGAVHALGDELASPAAEARFTLFFDLMFDRLAGLVRERAGDTAGRGEAGRLVADGQLASWAELWERVAADRADTLALNLDRKQLILDTFARLSAAAGARG